MISTCPYCGEPYEPVRLEYNDGEYCAVCMGRAVRDALRRYPECCVMSFINHEAIRIYKEKRGEK